MSIVVDYCFFFLFCFVFFCQAEDGIRDLVRSRGLGDVYKRQGVAGPTVSAMDILFPGIGEIIGGSQREERLDLLLRRMNEMHIPVSYTHLTLPTSDLV